MQLFSQPFVCPDDFIDIIAGQVPCVFAVGCAFQLDMHGFFWPDLLYLGLLA